MPGIAIEKEKQIKKWSKAKKEALIKGKFEDSPNLAKKKKLKVTNRSVLDTF
jgi:putative endonuclease